MQKSITDRLWVLQEVSTNYVDNIMRTYNLSEIEARLIANRVMDPDEIKNFIDPKIKNLMTNPNNILDMEKAVKRVISALENKEKICIYGDYDVDGATSSALLKLFLESYDAEVIVYIPDRMKDGYGLSENSLKKIHTESVSLIITVDTGSTAHEAVDFANSLGIDLIIIDHHLALEQLPNALAVINPNRLDESSEYKYLAAVGVSFLFAVCLNSELQKIDNFNNVEINLLDLLDLVALGTVCDMMPLVGLNRAFVKQGLKILASRKNIGLKILIDQASINQVPDCYHLGFILGPRINAGGRVGESYLGSKLLSTKCEIEAQQIALQLEEYNNQRKEIEKQILEDAIQAAAQQSDQNLIMVHGDWHPGVIGIIAGKLKELYMKPVAVVSVMNNVCKASCRSIKGIDFGSALSEAKINNLVEVGGGHAMAAGFTTSLDKLDKLRDFLNKRFGQYTEALDSGKIYHYELELSANAVSEELYHKIHSLSPFGNGNPEPIIKINGLFVLKAYIVGEKHVNCLLSPDRGSYGSNAIKAIAFNAVNNPLGEILLSTIPHNISIIGQIKLQHYNGNIYPQIVINDLII